MKRLKTETIDLLEGCASVFFFCRCEIIIYYNARKHASIAVQEVWTGRRVGLLGVRCPEYDAQVLEDLVRRGRGRQLEGYRADADPLLNA